MAVTRETLRLLRNIRIALDDTVDASTEDLVRAWARTWDTLVSEWEAAVSDLQTLRADGGWPTRGQIVRAERAMKAIDLTRNALDDLADNAGVRILQAVPDAVSSAEGHLQVIASQYPREAGSMLELAATFDRVDADQLTAIVRRTTEQVTSLLRPLPLEATSALYTELIRGVALGSNPRASAHSLLRRLEGRFNGGLTRAMVICRTEIVDAHRAAAAAQHAANADTLRGWQWSATLDKRTCPSCWSKHGTEYPLTEPGPLDHQQGRCARLPVTKTWADLGFGDVEEPASLMPDAETKFRELSGADQTAIMGPDRLRLLDSGDISWADLSSRRSTAGWRDSWAPTAVRDLAS